MVLLRSNFVTLFARSGNHDWENLLKYYSPDKFGWRRNRCLAVFSRGEGRWGSYRCGINCLCVTGGMMNLYKS